MVSQLLRLVCGRKFLRQQAKNQERARKLPSEREREREIAAPDELATNVHYCRIDRE
jgi:hypothetical protein